MADVIGTAPSRETSQSVGQSLHQTISQLASRSAIIWACTKCGRSTYRHSTPPVLSPEAQWHIHTAQLPHSSIHSATRDDAFRKSLNNNYSGFWQHQTRN